MAAAAKLALFLPLLATLSHAARIHGVPEVGITLGPNDEGDGKWYEASAGAEVPGKTSNVSEAPLGLPSSESCVPRCSWKCTTPQCNQVCVPHCSPPRCRTRCPRPNVTGCNVTCGQPHCYTECPPLDHLCTGQDCARCKTKCQEGPCKMDCHKDLSCNTECEQPQCTWSCRAPKVCPEPVCKMVCEVSQDSCPNCTFHAEFPQQIGDSSVVVWEGLLPNATTGGPRGKPYKDNVFNPHAGNSTIDGATVDADGNIVGDVGDLVPDGAFRGQSVVILQLCDTACSGTLKDMEKTVAALKDKGFTVTLFTYNKVPSSTVLDDALKTANQFWLISTNKAMLSTDHLSVIDRNWRAGMGMYLLGDNEPYYVDANKVLTRIGLPPMSGNVYGDKKVHKRDPTKPHGPGFSQHLLTTGIVSLYEGITVATFSDTAVQSAGMVDVLRDHEYGKIVVVFLDAKEGHGAVVADGGFTKMASDRWDTAGTARFVKNVAAMLAVQ